MIKTSQLEKVSTQIIKKNHTTVHAMAGRAEGVKNGRETSRTPFLRYFN